MKKEIDVIIPAYNAHNTIGKTLASITTQTLSDIMTVTIVNDCSEKDYSEFIDMYSHILDVREITLEKNVGCGIARQIGIDNTNNKYIVFVDSDDLFSTPFSVFSLYANIEKGNNGKDINVVYGGITEVDVKNNIIKTNITSSHGTWVFGSIYRRRFIEQNGIKFNDSSRGEDLSFNKICKLLSDKDQIGYLDIDIYLWTNANDNRINSRIFRNLYSKIGFVENLIYVYKFLGNRRNPNFTVDDMKLDALSNFLSLYFQYEELIEIIDEVKQDMNIQKIRESIDNMIDLYKELYMLTYKKYESIITSEDISYVYSINLERMMSRGGGMTPRGILFFDFLNDFKDNNENELKQIIFNLL